MSRTHRGRAEQSPPRRFRTSGEADHRSNQRGGPTPQKEARMVRRRWWSEAAALAVIVGLSVPALAQQVPLNPRRVPQFVDPLPLLGPDGVPVLLGTAPGTVSICEFQTQILPAGALGRGTPAPDTWVWGYEIGDTCVPNPTHAYIGPVVVANRGTPSELTFINQLGDTSLPAGAGGTHVLAYSDSTDQTLHWADPWNGEQNLCNEQASLGFAPTGYCATTTWGRFRRRCICTAARSPPTWTAARTTGSPATARARAMAITPAR